MPSDYHSEPTPFEKELTDLINKHSVENESDTPDFILADYLQGCLRAFTYATKRREKWHQTNAIKSDS